MDDDDLVDLFCALNLRAKEHGNIPHAKMCSSDIFYELRLSITEVWLELLCGRPLWNIILFALGFQDLPVFFCHLGVVVIAGVVDRARNPRGVKFINMGPAID